MPPSTAELIRALPPRIDTPLLFPTPTGRLWHESNFRRDVWNRLARRPVATFAGTTAATHG
ncbi:MAG: hypothetical protein M3550_16180 [Actinomycetota bacterium]|nr:hypothetical protein [Actinomycetota bacterium]